MSYLRVVSGSCFALGTAALVVLVGCMASCRSSNSNSAGAAAPVVGPIEMLRIPSLDRISRGDPEATLNRQESGWRITTKRQWTYAAAVPLLSIRELNWTGNVQVHCQTATGSVQFGLLNNKNKFVATKTIDKGTGPQEVSLPISSSDDVTLLIVRSAAPQGDVSDALVESVDLVVPAIKLIDVANLENIAPAYAYATVEKGHPTRVVTAAQQYSYAARVPLSWAKTGDGFALVQIRAQARSGQVGFGVLDRSGNFQGIESATPSPKAMDFFVPVSAPGKAGDLIVRNEAKNAASEVVIDNVTIWILR